MQTCAHKLHSDTYMLCAHKIKQEPRELVHLWPCLIQSPYLGPHWVGQTHTRVHSLSLSLSLCLKEQLHCEEERDQPPLCLPPNATSNLTFSVKVLASGLYHLNWRDKHHLPFCFCLQIISLPGAGCLILSGLVWQPVFILSFHIFQLSINQRLTLFSNTCPWSIIIPILTFWRCLDPILLLRIASSSESSPQSLDIKILELGVGAGWISSMCNDKTQCGAQPGCSCWDRVVAYWKPMNTQHPGH